MVNVKVSRKTISVTVAIIGLAASIIIHEFGHFLACKLFGVETPIFSVGFGPQLLAYKIGNTTFQLAALPLGGFVAINPESFDMQPYWHQLIIMIAGIIGNLLFALGIFCYITSRGIAQAMPIINEVTPNSPADHAGVLPHDTIRALNHIPVESNANNIINTLLQAPGQTVIFTIERDEDLVDISVPVTDKHPIFGPDVGWAGISLATINVKPKRITHSMRESIRIMQKTIGSMAASFSAIFARQDKSGVSGPIGIISLTSKSLMLGSNFFLMLLAFLNINIALFNLLPIPLFDGGKIVLYTIQAITGPIAPTALEAINTTTLIILLILFVFITLRDVLKLKR